jgi:hypothetical protein
MLWLDRLFKPNCGPQSKVVTSRMTQRILDVLEVVKAAPADQVSDKPLLELAFQR